MCSSESINNLSETFFLSLHQNLFLNFQKFEQLEYEKTFSQNHAFFVSFSPDSLQFQKQLMTKSETH